MDTPHDVLPGAAWAPPSLFDLCTAVVLQRISSGPPLSRTLSIALLGALNTGKSTFIDLVAGAVGAAVRGRARRTFEEHPFFGWANRTRFTAATELGPIDIDLLDLPGHMFHLVVDRLAAAVESGTSSMGDVGVDAVLLLHTPSVPQTLFPALRAAERLSSPSRSFLLGLVQVSVDPGAPVPPPPDPIDIPGRSPSSPTTLAGSSSSPVSSFSPRTLRESPLSASFRKLPGPQGDDGPLEPTAAGPSSPTAGSEPPPPGFDFVAPVVFRASPDGAVDHGVLLPLLLAIRSKYSGADSENVPELLLESFEGRLGTAAGAVEWLGFPSVGALRNALRRAGRDADARWTGFPRSPFVRAEEVPSEAEGTSEANDSANTFAASHARVVEIARRPPVKEAAEDGGWRSVLARMIGLGAVLSK
ncbi:hypothetical protein DFJ74DRAFT_661413 [Hyaloraphidium curvatum]|nr:hypothetical protein DFJ74DRAFT_661413 [Hyaloraphidium curvatum]